jgi:hypothetical protein
MAFRHPLAQSAAYRSATPQERRAAHAALAVATDASRDPDRRAWHRALAVVDTDEDVAAELAASAGRARGRGGLLAAATFLEKAAELSPGVEQRTARMLAAAGLLVHRHWPGQRRTVRDHRLPGRRHGRTVRHRLRSPATRPHPARCNPSDRIPQLPLSKAMSREEPLLRDVRSVGSRRTTARMAIFDR